MRSSRHGMGVLGMACGICVFVGTFKELMWAVRRLSFLLLLFDCTSLLGSPARSCSDNEYCETCDTLQQTFAHHFIHIRDFRTRGGMEA